MRMLKQLQHGIGPVETLRRRGMRRKKTRVFDVLLLPSRTSKASVRQRAFTRTPAPRGKHVLVTSLQLREQQPEEGLAGAGRQVSTHHLLRLRHGQSRALRELNTFPSVATARRLAYGVWEELGAKWGFGSQ